MQLSPSSAFSDPNLLAAAFPVAAALSVDATASIAQPDSGVAFSDVFAGLAPSTSVPAPSFAAATNAPIATPPAAETKPVALASPVFSPPLALGLSLDADQSAPPRVANDIPVEPTPRREPAEVAQQPVFTSEVRHPFRSTQKPIVPEQRDHRREPERAERAADSTQWPVFLGFESAVPAPATSTAPEPSLSIDDVVDGKDASDTPRNNTERPAQEARGVLGLVTPPTPDLPIGNTPSVAMPEAHPETTRMPRALPSRSATDPVRSTRPQAEISLPTQKEEAAVEQPESEENGPVAERSVGRQSAPLTSSTKKVKPGEHPAEVSVARAAFGVPLSTPVAPVVSNDTVPSPVEEETAEPTPRPFRMPTLSSTPREAQAPRQYREPAQARAVAPSDFDENPAEFAALPTPAAADVPPAAVPAESVATSPMAAEFSAELPEAADVLPSGPQSPTIARFSRTPARVATSLERLEPEASQRAFLRKENFAASEPPAAARANGDQKRSDKSFVAAEEEDLTTRNEIVGISVAKPQPTMSRRFAPASFSHPASGYAVAAAGVAAPVLDAAAPAPAAVTGDNPAFATVGTAHRAVEAVLQAVDHVASRERSAVNLEFSVGDADLKVRVELHADEVRTTFHTDSTELRAALTHEWQALTATPNTDRGFRLAPAVFATADQSALNTLAGDASSQQRDRRARHDEPQPAARGRGLGAIASSRVAVQPTAQPAAAAANSRHLRILA